MKFLSHRKQIAALKRRVAELEADRSVLEREVDKWQKVCRFWQDSYRELETKPPATSKGKP